ncbi:MAG: HEAT repeat domain-containing protein [Planctomycetota bacterium]
MNRTLALAALSLVPALSLAGCSSGPTLRTEADPELTKKEQQRIAKDTSRRRFEQVLIKLDQAMESYALALANQGDPRADKQADQLEKYLQDLVLDNKAIPAGADPNDYEIGENLRLLRGLAADTSEPRQQGIALAALGFSGRHEVSPLIEQGTMSDDPDIVDKAVFGLAVLRAPQTLPGPLAAVVENPQHPEDGRVQAAWALYRVQTVSTAPAEIVKYWQRFLGSEKDRLPAGVLVTAVRGLGLTGDAAYAELVAPVLRHPVPRLRMAAALALGRMNAQTHWRDLLALMEPAESVQNVRLHARKALAALAGNKDYGYDLAAWRKVFDRGEAGGQ